METIDEYGDNKDVSLVGFPADNDWVFYAINGYDKVLMHNPLAHELYRQLGRYSSRTRFVEVYLKDDSGAPGPITAADYNGLYVLEEKVKIAERPGRHRRAPGRKHQRAQCHGRLLVQHRQGRCLARILRRQFLDVVSRPGRAPPSPRRSERRKCSTSTTTSTRSTPP